MKLIQIETAVQLPIIWGNNDEGLSGGRDAAVAAKPSVIASCELTDTYRSHSVCLKTPLVVEISVEIHVKSLGK